MYTLASSFTFQSFMQGKKMQVCIKLNVQTVTANFFALLCMYDRMSREPPNTCCRKSSSLPKQSNKVLLVTLLL